MPASNTSPPGCALIPLTVPHAPGAAHPRSLGGHLVGRRRPRRTRRAAPSLPAARAAGSPSPRVCVAGAVEGWAEPDALAVESAGCGDGESSAGVAGAALVAG